MAKAARRRRRRRHNAGAAENAPRRRRRSRGRRRGNPLWRKVRSGRYSGSRTRRRLHRIRGGVGWHNPRRRRRSRGRRRSYRRNSVIPVSWNRRRRRRGGRRYRRNAVLPISWNRTLALGGRGGIVEAITRPFESLMSVDAWTEKWLPGIGGFVGSKTLGATINGFLSEKILKISSVDAAYPWVKLASEAAATGVLSWAAGRFIGSKQGEAVLFGGILGIAHSILKMVLGGTEIGRAIGIDGLGDDLADRMRSAVAQRVYSELSGMGTYLTEQDLLPQMAGGVGEYLTDTQLRMQPGYAPLPSGDLRDYEVARSETTL